MTFTEGIRVLTKHSMIPPPQRFDTPLQLNFDPPSLARFYDFATYKAPRSRGALFSTSQVFLFSNVAEVEWLLDRTPWSSSHELEKGLVIRVKESGVRSILLFGFRSTLAFISLGVLTTTISQDRRLGTVHPVCCGFRHKLYCHSLLGILVSSILLLHPLIPLTPSDSVLSACSRSV
jgi:hypothetical protein